MSVSIILCTRNRADSLRETLASIGRCEVPADLPAELLVVDNGSSDHTRQVVEQVNLTNLPIRYVHEPSKGKGYAYNTGMADARGDIFLFTDDDVRVPTNWIEGMCRPIARGDTDATTGEVHIAPHLLRPWMTPAHRGFLLDIRDMSEQHKRSPFLIGANMAFTSRVLEKLDGFEPALGPGGTGFMDETLLYLQMLEAGYRLSFVAGIPVEHHFDPKRLTRESQLESAKAHGRSSAWVMHHWSHGEVSYPLMRELLNLLRCRFRAIAATVRGVTAFDPREIDYTLRHAIYRELRALAGSPRLYPKHGLHRQPSTASDGTHRRREEMTYA
jgi:glycosyltransferase involved in cell wall biosynthesis